MPVPSPCIKVCAMDARREYCEGCWRSLSEIAAWGTMSDAERLATLARLEARRQAQRP